MANIEYKWHKYPKEIPANDGYYIVTWGEQYIPMDCAKVEILAWQGVWGYFELTRRKESSLPKLEFFQVEGAAIAAWTELPEPYLADAERGCNG